ncbi:hypothetical protein JA9_001701 [Meyerozyma sp. JA9]|nr:hypothetical protein JA9_001701 [Meyerozyma sp. JA9]
MLMNKKKPLMQSPFPHPFWEAFRGVGAQPLCKDEWKIIDLSNSIREKPDWKIKYKDPVIADKWKKEYIQQIEGKTRHGPEIVDFVLKELQWYEKLADNEAGFECGCSDSIAVGDKAVSKSIRESFVANARKLEHSFEGNFDYHPGSNNQVIDLVHPSLFPLQYGTTPIKVGSKYAIAEYTDDIQKVKQGVESFGVSKNFQWLPAVMKLEDGKYNFASYINNLHPKRFKPLYDDISDIFNAIIPGLNLTLSRYASGQYIRIPIPSYTDVYTKEYNDKMGEIWDEVNDDDIDIKIEELEEKKADYVKPFPPVYSEEPKTAEFDIKSFPNLKVIVKIASIELTPENPKYPGGSWHVEGTINEDIVATVLYYYDVENISESRLSFRTAFEDPQYEQGDAFYCDYFFGIKDESPMTRNQGSVVAKEGRVVVFPNCFQHHVDGFELADKSKKGHRKILCFFVVDPHNKVVKATSEVSPQQKEWWDQDTEELSSEIKAEIVKINPDWPQTLEATKAVRSKLMEERSASVQLAKDDGMEAFTREFSLCEH